MVIPLGFPFLFDSHGKGIEIVSLGAYVFPCSQIPADPLSPLGECGSRVADPFFLSLEGIIEGLQMMEMILFKIGQLGKHVPSFGVLRLLGRLGIEIVGIHLGLHCNPNPV